jgi:hypothetical protein
MDKSIAFKALSKEYFSLFHQNCWEYSRKEVTESG